MNLGSDFTNFKGNLWRVSNLGAKFREQYDKMASNKRKFLYKVNAKQVKAAIEAATVIKESCTCCQTKGCPGNTTTKNVDETLFEKALKNGRE
jgi:hypothetical protein